MMTRISLRAFAGQIGGTSYTRTGTREAIGAIDGAEVGAECRLVGPKTESRVRLELACRKRAALSVDCMRISLGMLVFELLGSSCYASIAVLGALLYAEYEILHGRGLPSRWPSIHSERAL